MSGDFQSFPSAMRLHNQWGAARRTCAKLFVSLEVLIGPFDRFRTIIKALERFVDLAIALLAIPYPLVPLFGAPFPFNDEGP